MQVISFFKINIFEKKILVGKYCSYKESKTVYKLSGKSKKIYFLRGRRFFSSKLP